MRRAPLSGSKPCIASCTCLHLENESNCSHSSNVIGCLGIVLIKLSGEFLAPSEHPKFRNTTDRKFSVCIFLGEEMSLEILKTGPQHFFFFNYWVSGGKVLSRKMTEKDMAGKVPRGPVRPGRCGAAVQVPPREERPR